MIYNVQYGDIHDRSDALEYLDDNNFSTVIDVGASANMWGYRSVTHTIDMFPHESAEYHQFIGNICEPTVWQNVANYKTDKFDFAICTHTFEDIINPVYVANHMVSIAREGYVAMPSKWAELSCKGQVPFKGWLHHRWLFDVIEGTLVCVPKLPYLEYIDTTAFVNKPEEIRFFWKDDMPIKILNNDYIGPSEYEYIHQIFEFLNH